MPDKEKLATRKAIRLIIAAIVDTVKSAKDDGAPGGVLYMACIKFFDLERFEMVMQVLVDGGYLRKSNNKYYWLKDLP